MCKGISNRLTAPLKFITAASNRWQLLHTVSFGQDKSTTRQLLAYNVQDDAGSDIIH